MTRTHLRSTPLVGLLALFALLVLGCQAPGTSGGSDTVDESSSAGPPTLQNSWTLISFGAPW